MKTLSATIISLGVAAALAACTPKPAETAAPAATPPPAAGTVMAPSSDMAPMPDANATSVVSVSGTGTVTELDATAGTITIDHQPIAAANWPAMVMGFKAAPAVVQGVKVGDQVDFDLRLQGGAGEVTAIRKK